MSLTGKLKRFDLIINKVERTKYPSLQAILKYLENYGHTVTARTLQRDLEELKSEFKIFIEYSSFNRGYFIEKDSMSDSVIQFIKNMTLQANLLDFAKLGEHSNAIILKENHALKGVEFIPQILTAIQQQLQIEFSYQAFEKDKPKNYTVQAYALKEYLGRWYMVACSTNRKGIVKFGVDRILSMTITEVKFKKDKQIDLSAYFSRMIGIIDEGAACEQVILSFTPMQAKYVRTLPWHWSQEEVLTNDKEVHFEYFILTNYELMQKILSYGNTVTVVKPATLKKEHQRYLKEALAQYKK